MNTVCVRRSLVSEIMTLIMHLDASFYVYTHYFPAVYPYFFSEIWHLPENSTEEKRSPQGHLMSIVKSTMLVR